MLHITKIHFQYKVENPKCAGREAKMEKLKETQAGGGDKIQGKEKMAFEKRMYFKTFFFCNVFNFTL